MEIIKYLEIAFYIFIIYKIWKDKNQENAFYWFVYGCILLYPMTYIGKGFPFPIVILPIVSILRTWKDGRLKKEWSSYPLRTIMLLMILYHLIHPFISSWMPIQESLKREIFNLSMTYTVVLAGYLLAPQDFNKKKLIRNILIISGVLIVTGMLCWILKSNFIAASFSSTGDSYFGSDRVDTERGFRATGTQFSPNSYGNALVLCILMINHYCKNKVIKYGAIGLLLLCIVFTASRAPLFILILGVGIYYLFQKKSKLLKSLLIISVIFSVFSEQLMNNEYIGKYVGGVIDLVVTGGENTIGSSTDLRELQWLVTLTYLDEAFYFGHGEDYTMQLVNENGIFYNLKDQGLAGAEGYQYITLIDYGISYMILSLIFFLLLYIYFIKNYKKNNNKEICIFGIIFTSCLFVFLLSSRPNHVWQIYFPFIGLFLKSISSHKITE